MKKTPLSKPYARRLNDINDQLCFGALAAEEIRRVIEPEGGPVAEASTTTLFPANHHAARINRSMVDLPGFGRQVVSTLCISALIAGSEFMQAYCGDALKRIQADTGFPAVEGSGGQEDRLRALLMQASVPVMAGFFDTVTYLRRRRNNLVHADGQFTNEFEAYYTKGPEDLRRFWATRPVDLLGFDFGNRRIDEFSIEDGYAMMNLFRICMAEIDAAVVEALPLPSVVATVATEILARGPQLRSDPRRLAKKVRMTLLQDYGIVLDDAGLEPLLLDVIG